MKGLYKAELVERYRPWRSLDELELAILEHIKPFSSWVAVVLGVLEDQDRLDDRGGSVWVSSPRFRGVSSTIPARCRTGGTGAWLRRPSACTRATSSL